MRVLVVSSLFPNPLRPDRAPFNRQQITALAVNHEVRVIAPIAWTSEWMGRSHGSLHDAMPPERRLVRDGVIVYHPHYLFAPKVLRGLHGHSFARSIRRTFHSVVADFHPDVVLGCWAYPDGWAAVQLARGSGLPVAIKVQGSDVLRVVPGTARAKRTAQVLEGADAVIAVGREVADRAVALGAARSRVRVVYNGVDTTLFCAGSKEAARRELGVSADDALISYVGNLAPVKGVDVLMNAFARLVRSGSPARCVLVGDGPARGALERLVASRGLTGRVRFVGSCPLERVVLWHRATDLLVLPSRSEGVPNVLREAQACGTPFLASRVGGVAEIAPPGALFPAGDVENLARRIRDALEVGVARSPSAPPDGPGAATWAQSAQELSDVLDNIVQSASRRVRRAG